MRRLPPAFLIAIVIQVLIVAARLAILAADKLTWMRSPAWSLTAQGTGFATLALLAAGSFHLARRSSGSRAAAARFAGIAFLIGIALSVAGALLDHVQMGRANGPIEVLWDIEGYAWSAVMIAGFAALVTAGDGWRSAAPLAGVAMVAIVISRGPRFLTTPIYEALGRSAGPGVMSALWLTALCAVIALLARAIDPAEPPEDAEACERGLRRAASALWVRVIAAAAMVGMTMIAVMAARGGGLSVLKLAMVAAPVINTFALISFGFGAFLAARSGVRDLASGSLYVGGALSVWAGGALLVQLPWLYQVVYSNGGSYAEDHGREMVAAFALVIPLVAGAGVVALITAISGFARRRDLQHLRERATTGAGGFVILIIVSLLVQQYGLPKARSQGTFLVMSLVAAGAGLAAIAMVAKVFTLAADAIRQAPGLPTATVHEQ